MTSEEPATNEFAVSMMALTDLLAPVAEAVEGYRVERVREGYDEHTARKMAADYNAALLRVVAR